MRFDSYLTESAIDVVMDTDTSSIEDIAKRIKSDCSHYMRTIKGNALYRGINRSSLSKYSLSNGALGVKNVRQKREPRGMNPWQFKHFNKWLSENGHVSRYSSISVIGDYNRAVQFGNTFVVYPVGKFDYSWAETTDINYNSGSWDIQLLDRLLDLLGELSKGGLDPAVQYAYQSEVDDIDANLSLKVHTNKGISTAINNGYEIWMNPKKYYLVTLDTHNQLRSYL